MRQNLLSRSAYIFCIRALPALSVILVNVLLTRKLPKELNGHYQQIWVYLTVLVSLGSLGIPALAITHNIQKLQRWLRALKGRHVGLLLLLNAGIALSFGALLRATGINPWLLTALYLGQFAALLSETFLVLEERFKTLVIVVACYTLAFTAIHFAFLQEKIGFNALISGITLLLGIRASLLSIFCLRSYLKKRGTLRPGRMPQAARRQWLQLGVYDISQLVFRYIDKLMVGWLITPAVFAVYNTGTMDIPLLSLLLGAAGTALLRQLAGGATDVASKLEMLHFSGTTLARIVFPVFSFLFVFRSEVITEVFGAAYAAAIPLFGISVLAIPLRAYNFTAMLQHLNRVRIINVGAVIDLLIAIGLSYPLYQWLGLPGIAIAFTVCSYVQAVFYLSHTARLLKRPVLDLIPGGEWLMLILVYFAAEKALRAAFMNMTSTRNALLLGFATTIFLIGGSLYPIIFRKRNG
jgi:O-antigen/teichoic acid export membrane protein